MKQRTASLILSAIVTIGIFALSANFQTAEADSEDTAKFFLDVVDQLGDPLAYGEWIGELNEPVVIGPLLVRPPVVIAVTFSFGIGYRLGKTADSISLAKRIRQSGVFGKGQNTYL